jgi:putative tricarboxylic transport membrane protein
MMETSVRQSLRLFGGDATGFVTRPISGGMIVLPLAKVLLARRAVSRAAHGGQPTVVDSLFGVHERAERNDDKEDPK